MKPGLKFLILLSSILAWGWFNQQWLVSGMLVFFMVVNIFTAWRWNISRQQFYRIGDLATTLIILMLIYSIFAQSDQKSVFIILKWLPVFLAPVLLAQLFSSQDTVPLGILFYSVRKRQSPSVLDFKIPYAGLCLLSSGAGNYQTPIYFIIVVALFSLILWTIRSRQGSIIAWLLVISVSAIAAYWAQQGLRSLHAIVEEKAVDWLSDWRTDPFKSSSSIGDIGELKLSDRIEFRVKATEPLLLQQSSYDWYMEQSWYASKRAFTYKEMSEGKSNEDVKQLTVFQQSKSESILALPYGTVDIKGLEGASIQTTELGTVKLTEAPDFIEYQVFYTGRQLGEASRYDLDVPQQHKNWIALIKKELKLEGQPAKSISRAIKKYFQTNYYYTLFLGLDTNSDTALQTFILKRKAGHCEYFAVASVFLLRSYGIPARLANGYSMDEYDPEKQMYIVRRRHAHAWAIAHIDGYWQAVDATPSEWLNIEEENADIFQPVYDWASSLYFIYKQWRYQQTQLDDNDTDSLLWISIGIVLFLYLAWRLYLTRQQMIRKKLQSETVALPSKNSGLDSELYLIEQALSKTENARLNNESIAIWAKRVNIEALILITKIHYSYRFDPQGISDKQRVRLKQSVENLLEEYG